MISDGDDSVRWGPWELYRRLVGKATVVVLSASLSSCGPTSMSGVENIFGADDRKVAPDAGAYRAVGRFDVGCSGTLIGKRLVLTAAHCIVDNATGAVKASMTYFRPHFRGGQAAESIWTDYFWLGSEKPEDERVNDWAVVRLEREPAEALGSVPLASRDITAGMLPYAAILVGYSVDIDQGKNPSLSDQCGVREIVDGKFFHDCDGASGVSGGPLLSSADDGQAIIGVTVSEYRQGAPASVHRDTYTREYANVAVPARQFAQVVRTLLQTADNNTPPPAVAGAVGKKNPNPHQPDQPGPDNPYDPTKVRPLAQLMESGVVLNHIGDDVVLAGDTIQQTVQSAAAPSELKAAASALVSATHRLSTTTAVVITGNVGNDYKTRLFSDYQAVKVQERALLSFQVGGGLGASLSAALARLAWVIKQFESYVFVH